MGHYEPGLGWVLDEGESAGSPTSYTDPTPTPTPAAPTTPTTPTTPSTPAAPSTPPPTVTAAPGTGTGNGSLPLPTEVVSNPGNPASSGEPVGTGYTPSTSETVVVEPGTTAIGGLVDALGIPLPGTVPDAAGEATPDVPVASTPSGPGSSTFLGVDLPDVKDMTIPPAAGSEFVRQWQNIVKPGDYAALDLTNAPAFASAQKLYTDSLASAMKANADALAAYSGAAMQSATQQGLENVYGTENAFGAQGAGMSGAARAAAARGMATPIAQAQQQIAGMSAEQASQLNAQRFGAAQDLVSTYTGVVAPQYASSMSPGEINLMKELAKSGS